MGHERQAPGIHPSIVSSLVSSFFWMNPLKKRKKKQEETGRDRRDGAPWTDVNLGLAAEIRDESHGGCQVNGPKVAKFLDR